MIIKNPVPTPKQNFIDFFSPTWFAKPIAIILLGPGVKLATNAYKNKETNTKLYLPFQLVCYNVFIRRYNVHLCVLLYITIVIK